MDAARVVRGRGGLPESEHRVRVAIWRDGAAVVAGGRAEERVFLRSAAKPVQALACLVTGAAERFGFETEDIAIACGSHNGEPAHVRRAEAMLAAAGLGPEALLCGAHPPVHAGSAAALVASGAQPTPLHNNCSGKHAAMLASCVAAGWPTEDYIAPEHPLQQMNRRHVAVFSATKYDAIHLGTDGCSVPVFAVPLHAAARLVGRIAGAEDDALPDDLASHRRRIAAAMVAAPEMVGGTGRSDTDLMRAADGRVISKVGAEGVWCLGVPERRAGITVKCLDGSSDAARRVGLELLRASGVLSDAMWAALLPHREETVRNHRGLDVGRVRVTLPAAIVEALR